MSIQSLDNTAGPFIGNNALAVYTYGFRITDENQIRVVETTALGVISVLTLGADFTVSGVGDDAGGSVTRTAGNLPTGYLWYMLRVPVMLQGTEYNNQGDYFPEIHEDSFDLLTIISQYLNAQVELSLRLDENVDHSGVSVTLPEPSANTTIIWDATGENLIVGPSSSQISSAEANASLTAADVVLTNADVVLTNADVVSSGTSATNASNSATAAQAAADSVIWNDVQFKTFADTPITIAQGDDGALLSVDTSGGNVVINLPTIAGLGLPFTIGVKKSTSDVNTVTINRNGTDTIEGANSISITAQNDGMTLIPDTDTSPDQWSTARFGSGVSVSGNNTWTGDNTWAGNNTWSGDNEFPAAASGLTRGGVEVATVDDVANSDRLIPLGVPIPLPTSVIPVNYLAVPIAATAVSRATYPELHTLMAADSYPWGNGDGTTTFNIPFLIEGHVPLQANGNVASASNGAVITHTHTQLWSSGSNGSTTAGSGINPSSSQTSSTGGTYNEAAGNKFRFAMRYR